MSNPYCYASIADGHIRLLALLPGDESDPLCCTIFSSALDSRPNYEAISYAWGEPTFSESLLVSTQEIDTRHEPASQNTRSIPITQHLSRLLRCLRGNDTPRILWVDAVCINQVDIAERNDQVRVMRQVYTLADRVVIWLGVASEDGSSDRALRFLKKMAMHKKYYGRQCWIGDERQGSDTSSECGVGEHAMDDGAEDNGEEEPEEDGTEIGDADERGHLVDDDEHSESSVANSSTTLIDRNRTNGQAEVSMLYRQFLDWLDRVRRDLRWKWYIHVKSRTWNPVRRWKYARSWKRTMEALARNRALTGHLQFGIPVLYENDLCIFFRDQFREDWEALDSLLARPWWNRTWVVQEVWSSSDKTLLQCGRTTIKWKTFQKGMDYEEAWDDMGDQLKGTAREAQWSDLKRRYGLAIHLSKKRLVDSKLSDLLWNTWDREATDPRDKVFAMLGLIGANNSETNGRDALTKADYAKSMAQVYREAARDIISGEDSLDILLAASGIRHKSGGQTLPSWVPDWRQEANAERPMLFVNRQRLWTLYFTGSMTAVHVNGHGYSASGDEKPAVRFSSEIATLHTNAIAIDEIQFVGERQGSAPINVTSVIDDAFSVSNRAEREVGNKAGQREVYSLDDIKKVLAAGGPGEKSYEDVIGNTMPLRRFFITAKNRHLCIGPASAREGDKIFLIAGCNFPMVLRETASDAGDEVGYELVGEAYVHGIMAGEAIQKLKSRPWWSRWWKGLRLVQWQEISIH